MQVVCNEIRDRINKYEKRDKNFENNSKKIFLSVVPSRLKFTFDSDNFKVQEKIIEITNYFPKPCPILLIPLESQYFRIANVFQRQWLNPGSVLKINILFIPDENRDYNDVLKIRYFNNQLMEIKIFAKIVTIFSFPSTVSFGNVPLDQPVCYKIPIRSHSKKEFSFVIWPSKENSCVDIYPRWGRVKANQEPLIIMIIYRPLRYISMHFQIRIFISDLCKTPHIINFYAYTRPGLLR
ncbi:cilia- and flagella-associated protein 221-like [Osmia bicornis bicornis]|uniref:cilia- and flagella-associated protein 221-like n=1 Tax=Osmia bicornis bicornis TaxID=1437191 RepID=UPI001EAEBEF9|nr:cilia- and flagella-associated protein 221-like [Osmia bicornis bicornis]